MRGASAIEEWLRQNPSQNVRVYLIWEPILPSDWQSPTQPVLSRVTDLRASQFWDKGHEFSAELKRHIRPNEPNCCEQDGALWDLVAVYAEGATLKSPPSFIGGPVVKSIKNVH